MSEILLHYPVINHTVVTQRFGENPKNYLQFGRAGHNGIDYGVAAGTEVYAAAVGVVEKVGKDPKGYGNYVLIQHEGMGRSGTDPYKTLYAHLWQTKVEKYRNVEAGDLIGISGSTGNSTGPHLHFELRIPAKASKDYPAGEVDPFPYFIAIDSQEEKDVTIKPGYAIVNCAPGLNVRLGPGLEYKIVGALLDGEQIKVVEVDGEWAKITLYVNANFLTRMTGRVIVDQSETDHKNRAPTGEGL